VNHASRKNRADLLPFINDIIDVIKIKTEYKNERIFITMRLFFISSENNVYKEKVHVIMNNMINNLLKIGYDDFKCKNEFVKRSGKDMAIPIENCNM